MSNIGIMGGAASTESQKILATHVERLQILEKNFSDIEHELLALRNRIFGEPGDINKDPRKGDSIPSLPCTISAISETMERLSQQQSRINNIANQLAQLA